MTTQTPMTDAAMFNHPADTRIASMEVVAELATVSRKLERDRAALIAALETLAKAHPDFNAQTFARDTLAQVRSGGAS